MSKILFCFIGLSMSINSLIAQTSYTIYDKVVFYDGYAAVVDEPVPDGITRISNAVYTTKLSEELINDLSLGKLSLDVTIGALCDNYDRIGDVYLAFVDKDATDYNQDEVTRIEIARFITPFMNKNNDPTEVPYHFQLDNVTEILKDENLKTQYDFWLEFEVFGVPYAANNEVQGCSGRNDVFEGTLVFTVEEDSQVYDDDNFLLSLSCKENLNNYNSTDVEGETTKIMNFTLDAPLNDAVLYFIVSNHGANTSGEEYSRREHYIYLDDELIFHYKPGGNSCEPFRQFNTQGNGIYGSSVKSLRTWLSFNNWCPGDKIPNREINLGNLSAGNHTIKLDVPDAVFYGQDGYFPVSMYIQNRPSGQEICADPMDLVLENQEGNSATVSWTEYGDSSNWEVLWGRKNLFSQNYDTYQEVTGDPVATKNDLTSNWYYEIFVRSICSEELNSVWVGPLYTSQVLGVSDLENTVASVYPNPTTDFINIKSDNPVEKISLFNMEGKLVLIDNSTKLDVSQLPSGNYLLIIHYINGKSESQKVVIR